MTKPGLILIGTGGHARACIDVIERQDVYRIIGLIGLQEQKDSQYSGYPIIGVDEDLPMLANQCEYALVAVGQIKTSKNRIKLYEQVINSGFKSPVILSPLAYVSQHARVGAGTIVMHGAILNSGSVIGSNCIINTNALIEHDAEVDSHCHISTGAILNGGVRVGARSFVGSGSVIKESISVGEDCIVGMGLTVKRDLENHVRLVG